MFRKYDVGSYRSLPDASRLIFVSHNVFFLIFLLTAVPYSFAMVSVLFGPSAPRNLLESSIYRSISFPLALQVVMYALEVRLAENGMHGKHFLALRKSCMTKLNTVQYCRADMLLSILNLEVTQTEYFVGIAGFMCIIMSKLVAFCRVVAEP